VAQLVSEESEGVGFDPHSGMIIMQETQYSKQYERCFFFFFHS
jgi:hypothetical protein